MQRLLLCLMIPGICTTKGSQAASWLRVPAELPQLIPTLLVSVSPNRNCDVYLRRSSNLATSIYWSQVDYRINTIQMDGNNFKLL